jgi:hypothetical protein
MVNTRIPAHQCPFLDTRTITVPIPVEPGYPYSNHTRGSQSDAALLPRYPYGTPLSSTTDQYRHRSNAHEDTIGHAQLAARMELSRYQGELPW